MTVPSGRRLFLLFLVGLLVVGAAGYWPLLRERFVFNDDTFFWAPGHTCFDHPQTYYLAALGRVFYPPLACPAWLWVHTLDDLSTIRWINFALMAAAMALFGVHLARHGMRDRDAFLLAATMLCLPTLQGQIILAHAFPHPIALLSAIAAFLVAERAMTRDRQARVLPLVLLSSFLLFAATATYTPQGMFYWAMLAVPLLWGPRLSVRQLALGFLPALATCVAFAAFAKVCFTVAMARAAITQDILGDHHVGITADWKKNVTYFWTRYLWLTCDLWNVSTVHTRTRRFLWIALVGLGYVRAFTRGDGHRVLALLCVPLSVGPLLVGPWAGTSYRMLTGLTALILVFGAWALVQLSHPAPRRLGSWAVTMVLAAAAVVSISAARYNLATNVIQPTQREFARLTEGLRPVVAAPDLVSRIEVVQAPVRYRGFGSADEYGLLTSSYSQNVRGLVRAALIERGVDEWALSNLHIVALRASQAVTPPGEGVVRVDLSGD